MNRGRHERCSGDRLERRLEVRVSRHHELLHVVSLWPGVEVIHGHRDHGAGQDEVRIHRCAIVSGPLGFFCGTRACCLRGDGPAEASAPRRVTVRFRLRGRIIDSIMAQLAAGRGRTRPHGLDTQIHSMVACQVDLCKDAVQRVLRCIARHVSALVCEEEINPNLGRPKKDRAHAHVSDALNPSRRSGGSVRAHPSQVAVQNLSARKGEAERAA